MPRETLRLADPHDFVELQVLERGTVGDLRLRVTVRSDGFSGEYDEVWVARQDWLAFADSLRTLERSRTGVASVASMSPGEFSLSLEAVNRAGHVAAHGVLSRYHLRPGAPAAGRSAIAFRVGVDPSKLHELVDALTELGQAHL
jgi:hypothetical protein